MEFGSNAFGQGLRELGYVYGKNVTFEYRYAEGKARQFPQLAAEMVGLPDVIFVNSTDFTAAAKQATSTIPVVSIGGDPVAPVVSSLARAVAISLGHLYFSRRKRKTIGAVKRSYTQDFLCSRALVSGRDEDKVQTEIAAKRFGVSIYPVQVRASDEFSAAFAATKKGEKVGEAGGLNPKIQVGLVGLGMTGGRGDASSC